MTDDITPEEMWWFRKPWWLKITNGQLAVGLGLAVATFVMIVAADDSIFKVMVGLYLTGRGFREGLDVARTERG